MRSRIGKLSIVVALTLSLGLHWALLQSVAWTGMIISYAQNSSLTDALKKTFDGQHPCKLCKLVNEGKKSEQQQDIQKPVLKLETFLAANQIFLFPPSVVSHSIAPSDSPVVRNVTPLAPPPRSV